MKMSKTSSSAGSMKSKSLTVSKPQIVEDDGMQSDNSIDDFVEAPSKTQNAMAAFLNNKLKMAKKQSLSLEGLTSAMIASRLKKFALGKAFKDEEKSEKDKEEKKDGKDKKDGKLM